MKYLKFTLLALFLSGTAMGAVRPFYQDVKLPTQQMVEKQTITNPAVAATVDILAGHAGPTTAAVTTATTFVAQPDVPRNIVITPGGSIASMNSCIVTVTGTNYLNDVITETFDFGANSATADTGDKAFKTVTEFSWAANCEDLGFAATWNAGYGEKLGLKRCMDAAGHYVFSTVAGAYESTRATIRAANDTVEGNTADFNGTMNGINDFEIFFLQNFLCTN